MSLITNAGEENQLFARHRTQIHLVPKSRADATGFPRAEPVGADPKGNELMADRRSVSSPGGRRPAAVAASKSAQD